MAKDEDLLSEAKEAFTLAADTESDNRIEALDDLRFSRLGEQWPEEVKRSREAEQRPCLTINRMPSFIRQVVNDARQNKPSIKVHPVDDTADPETAEIINGLIRNIEYTSNADVAYDTAIESAVTMGLGYWVVRIDYAHDDTFDMDLKIDRIANPFSVYGDPFSTAADSSDWNSAFITSLLSKDAFAKQYKGAKAVDWDTLGYSTLKQPWAEGDQVMLAEWWCREEITRTILKLSNNQVIAADDFEPIQGLFESLGISVADERDAKSWQVKQHIMTGAEILKTTDWSGIYIPIVPVYGDEVNVEGKRYFRSLIRDAKDPQRMLNYWRSMATEQQALAPKAPFIGPKGAFSTDSDKWTSANTKNWPFIEYDGPIPPQRQPYAGPSAGAIQESLSAVDDMKSVTGLYDASLGQRSNETSGRAILARQREGDVGTYHFIDNLARAIRHTGRILIDLIPSVYTGERVIRVLGPAGDDPTNVRIGPPGSQPSPQQQAQQAQEQEGEQQAIARIFNLTAGKYDLTVEAGPSFTTRREEAAAQMMDLLRSFPAAAPLIGDLVAKNLDWPGADEIAQRMKAMLPPQAQGPDPRLQQMQQALQQAQGKLGEAMHDKALEARKLDIDAFNAETNRLKVVQPTPGSPEFQVMLLQAVQMALSSPDILPQLPPQGMPPSGPIPEPPGPQMPPPQGAPPAPMPA